MIPPFIQQIIGVLIRYAVVGAAAYLAAHTGVQLNEEQIAKIVAYLVPVVGVVAWSLYSKYVGRQKLLTALATPSVITEHQVEAMVANPDVPTPSVNTPKNQKPV